MRRQPSLAALLPLLLLCACRNGASSLTVAVALLPGELPPYRAVLDQYERDEAESITLVPQQYADIRRALAAEGGGGRGTIDLVELDVFALAAAAADVAVLDRDSFGDLIAALDPASVAAGDLDGLRFLPHRISWQALIYNHRVLGAPPRTWDELIEVARQHSGQIGIKGSLSEALTCDVLPFVWSAGGSGETLADEGARAALDLFRQLAPHLHPHSSVFKESTIAEAMARGELVLHLNWPFVMSMYASQDLAPGMIRSAPLPRAPKGGRATVLGGGYLAIPRNAPNRERAEKLLRHLLSAAVQIRFRDELGWFSARADVPVGNDALLSGFSSMRKEVRPRPAVEKYTQLSSAWQKAFRAVMFDGESSQEAIGKYGGIAASPAPSAAARPAD